MYNVSKGATREVAKKTASPLAFSNIFDIMSATNRNLQRRTDMSEKPIVPINCFFKVVIILPMKKKFAKARKNVLSITNYVQTTERLNK